MIDSQWLRRRTPAVAAALLVAAFAGACGSEQSPTQASPRAGAGGNLGDPDSAGAGGVAGADAPMTVPDTGGGRPEAAAGAAGAIEEPPRHCSPVTTHLPIPQRAESLKEVRLDTFVNLAGQIELQCGNCHKAPAQQGNFSFTGSAKDLCAVRGKGPKAKGLTVADVMINGYMPFAIGGQQGLGEKVKAWLDQGCPEGTYELPGGDEVIKGDFVTLKSVGEALTDLGNCLPEAQLAGSDPTLDARFAAVTGFADLPASLNDTDFVSLDSAELAQHGTYAYSPTYPLYSDNARKLRHVHVPAGQAINYDSPSKQFVIPPNSRFYKTFLREVVDTAGHSRWRKMETRLIITRGASDTAIYGTYVWNSEETGAKLLGTGLDPASPDKQEKYLNGQPFSDYVFTYASDEAKSDQRSDYAVPGAQRCVSCHVGSLGDNFVLGWTPIQMKHRKAGEGGVYEDVLSDELGQLDRLAQYGVVKGFNEADLGNLEDSALPRTPRTTDELNMQAYMVGNCAHCHNPKGFAVKSASALNWLNMAPGGAIFGFDMRGLDGPKELDGENSYFANDPGLGPAASGNILTANIGNQLYGSGFLRRTLAPTRLLHKPDFPETVIYSGETLDDSAEINLHMPLHTGRLDCRLPRLVARWWGSVPRSLDHGSPFLETKTPTAADSARAKLLADTVDELVSEKCESFDSQMTWVLEDSSERLPYVERNIDWRSSSDAANRPPGWLQSLTITPEHEALAKKTYNLGYFKPGCQFPTDSPAPAVKEPWMLSYTTGKPDHLWSELYSVNPGEHVFASICANCHGAKGDAQTGAARIIRYTSGARVASFVDGLFGPRSNPGANLVDFDRLTSNGPEDAPERALGPNGAAKYLVWMADGGTHVSFGRTPEEEQAFLKNYVSYRAAGSNPLPVQPLEASALYVGARANMLQIAQKICRGLLIPTPHANHTFYPMDVWQWAIDSGETERGSAWSLAVDNPNAFGTQIWRDICGLNNPITPEVVSATDDSPLLTDWTNRAVFNAGVMAFIYMRDELSKGVYAPNFNQCEFRFPKNASVN